VKLLFDQNISFRILRLLSNDFPDARQVRELGLENTSDRKIWDFSRQSGYSIVTFDTDFYEMSNLYGHPPKIIWLRSGNTTTKNLARILKIHKPQIEDFLIDSEYEGLACLEIE
jgi:predicted nuclease of predicted toxin-antitoxin system